MAKLSSITALRAIGFLLKNLDPDMAGVTVAVTTAYEGANVEKLTGPNITRLVDSYIKRVPMPTLYDTATPPQPRAPTNDEKCGWVIKHLRLYLRAEVEAADKEALAKTAVDTNVPALEIELNGIIGDDS